MRKQSSLLPKLPENHYWKIKYRPRQKIVRVELKRHRLFWFPAVVTWDFQHTYYRDVDLEAHLAYDLFRWAEKAGEIAWKSS